MKMLAGRIIIPTTPGIKTPTKIPELEMEFFFQSHRVDVWCSGLEVKSGH